MQWLVQNLASFTRVKMTSVVKSLNVRTCACADHFLPVLDRTPQTWSMVTNARFPLLSRVEMIIDSFVEISQIQRESVMSGAEEEFYFLQGVPVRHE